MPDMLRVILGPILGALIGALAGWLQLRFGIILGQDDRDKLLASAMAVAAIVGAVVKRFLDARWFNPGNASSPTLAKVEKAEVESVTVVEAKDLRL